MSLCFADHDLLRRMHDSQFCWNFTFMEHYYSPMFLHVYSFALIDVTPACLHLVHLARTESDQISIPGHVLL